MNHPLRLLALAAVFLATTFAWLVLAAVMDSRTDEQGGALRDAVADLWGVPQHQQGPDLTLRWTTTEPHTVRTTDDHGREIVRTELRRVDHHRALQPGAARVDVDVHEDVRRKGLMWFPLYDLALQGRWTWTHDGDETGVATLTWPFPDASGFYDGFRLLINGQEQPLTVTGSAATATLPLQPGDTVAVDVSFRTRGTGVWSFLPTRDVGELRDFQLRLTTDFTDLDYPPGALSPSTRERTDDGWAVTWGFERLVTGKAMGVVVPFPIQPGELAARLTLSAPISLALFMLWIHVLGMLRRVDVHPVHHALLAAAFFSFHMLFGYSADRLPVEIAFALSSAVSVLLVTTYLARAVSPRFALLEAGGAQLVYLVGFGAAHFREGDTGLTLTLIGVGTLFALMQLTARIRWSPPEVTPGVRGATNLG